jgi:hypothetical protein
VRGASFAGFKQSSPGCFRGPSGLSPTSSAFNETQGILVPDDIIEAHFFFEVYASPTP